MRAEFTIKLAGGRTITAGARTLIVGVINVTPDSFSDGGVHLDPAGAAARAIEMEGDGADIIEIGGESTRPGATAVDAETELARVLPVLDAIRGKTNAPISIDTYKSVVACEALARGASIINDISALRFDRCLAAVVAGMGAGLVLMHMRGNPADMQQIAPSADILGAVESDLLLATHQAMREGVGRDQIIIDPGIGFGKTFDQNLQIINRLDGFSALGYPIMIGTSRKGFIGHLTGRAKEERVFGTAATVAASVLHGTHFVRVHDVREMADVVKVADAIAAAG